MSDSLVIIPTYNEKENIRKIISAALQLTPRFDVLIVDDGSPDGTAAEVKDMADKDPNRIFLIERKGKLGLGTAYIRGFRWGIENGYDYICEMDADFSHNPTDLIRLRQACMEGKGDLAIGSRYVRGGKCVNWPMDRLVLSRGASVYVRLITWMPIMDPTAGFVCYKRKVLETIDLNKIRFVGYAFQIEMKFAARSLGFKLIEIPITFTDRIEGSSKMTKGIVREAIFGVLSLRWKSFFESYK